jgi:2-methylaconitate cis-trans-isomerase PrpF
MKPSLSLPLRIRAHLTHGDTPQPRTAVQTPIPAAYYRGGTSRAVFFQPQHLPQDRSKWPAIFRQTMGSGDPYGRQLDGMGAGISSLSKICLVEPYGTRPLVARQAIAARVQYQSLDGARDLLEKVRARGDAIDGIDVDYTFVGLGIENDEVDVAGNCGNMSSAIGPYAYNAGLLPPRIYAKGNGEVTVRIRNTNTGKLINATFQVAGGQAAVVGEYTIDGVTGPASKIKLDFEQPYGSKTGKVLPTGNRTDRILGYKVSCVDGANPCIFIRASDVGVDGTILPNDFSKLPDKLDLLESIRKAAAVAMGIAPTEEAVPRTIPKIGLVTMSEEHTVLSGQMLQTSQTDLVVRFLSDTQPHRAIPLTAALTTAVAARIPGTLVEQLLSPEPVVDGAITIGHASGRLQVDAIMDKNDGVTPINATVYRTAKRLFEGTTFWVDNALEKAKKANPVDESKTASLQSVHGSNGTHSLGMAFVLESRGQSTKELFADDVVIEETPQTPQAPDPLEKLGFTRVRKYSSTGKTPSKPSPPPSVAKSTSAATPDNSIHAPHIPPRSPSTPQQTSTQDPQSQTTFPAPQYDIPATKGLEWDRGARKHAKSKKDIRKEVARRESIELRNASRGEFVLDRYQRSVNVLKINKQGRGLVKTAKGAKATAEEKDGEETESWSREEKEEEGFEGEDRARLMKEAVERDQAREARWKGKDS